MSDFIEDKEDRDNSVFSNAYKKHIERFGKEPYIIGMFWDNPEETELLIEKSIKDNKPYNEYNMLTDEEKILYDNGSLLF